MPRAPEGQSAVSPPGPLGGAGNTGMAGPPTPVDRAKKPTATVGPRADAPMPRLGGMDPLPSQTPVSDTAGRRQRMSRGCGASMSASGAGGPWQKWRPRIRPRCNVGSQIPRRCHPAVNLWKASSDASEAGWTHWSRARSRSPSSKPPYERPSSTRFSYRRAPSGDWTHGPKQSQNSAGAPDGGTCGWADPARRPDPRTYLPSSAPGRVDTLLPAGLCND